MGTRHLILLTAGVCGACCLAALLLVHPPDGRACDRHQPPDAVRATLSDSQPGSASQALHELEAPSKVESARTELAGIPDRDLQAQLRDDPQIREIREVRAIMQSLLPETRDLPSSVRVQASGEVPLDQGVSVLARLMSDSKDPRELREMTERLDKLMREAQAAESRRDGP